MHLAEMEKITNLKKVCEFKKSPDLKKVNVFP